MQYEIIVLGATFAAAGIAQKFGENCLIAERSTCAGYEFINALSFGTDYDKEPLSDEAKALFETFKNKKLLSGDRVCLYDCTSSFYKQLENKNVLLNTEIISVEKENDGFVCTLHNGSGYKTVTAKKVVDTRVHPWMIESKTFNFSLDCEGVFSGIDGMITEKWGLDRNVVLRCPVQKNQTMADARKKVLDEVLKLPEGIKLLALADQFDYVLNSGIASEKDGVMYLPSKAYKNPVLAFDAGVLFAGGVL